MIPAVPSHRAVPTLNTRLLLTCRAGVIGAFHIGQMALLRKQLGCAPMSSDADKERREP